MRLIKQRPNITSSEPIKYIQCAVTCDFSICVRDSMYSSLRLGSDPRWNELYEAETFQGRVKQTGAKLLGELQGAIDRLQAGLPNFDVLYKKMKDVQATRK
ncbi:uncharacterized protein LOC120848292 [Ixodes scapularis]|uniref:uncharacterized protein LOC120848292 n=1 Tax=Ixodes scapularis TaxID=6945 RepID=UPI001A9F3262|nr:uncharacterized protein LOC120848292 [Ixodes scapularis]